MGNQWLNAVDFLGKPASGDVGSLADNQGANALLGFRYLDSRVKGSV